MYREGPAWSGEGGPTTLDKASWLTSVSGRLINIHLTDVVNHYRMHAILQLKNVGYLVKLGKFLLNYVQDRETVSIRIGGLIY